MRTVRFLVAGLLVPCVLLAAPAVKSDDPAVSEIARLREEINLLNLLNGLNLTTKQIRELRSCASEAQELREAYFNQASQTVTEALESFRELRVVLAQNNGLPKRVEKRAALSNQRLKELTKQYDADIR